MVSASQPLLSPEIIPGVFDQVSDALYGNLWLDDDYQKGPRKPAQSPGNDPSAWLHRRHAFIRFAGMEGMEGMKLNGALLWTTSSRLAHQR